MIPSSAILDTASINFYIVEDSNFEYPIYALLSPWDENSATYNNTEVMRGEQIGTITGRQKNQWTQIALNSIGLALVQQWIQKPESNLGFVIGDSDATDGLDIACSERNNKGQRPTLTIAYH